MPQTLFVSKPQDKKIKRTYSLRGKLLKRQGIIKLELRGRCSKLNKGARARRNPIFSKGERAIDDAKMIK
jgi:hypothetical protein